MANLLIGLISSVTILILYSLIEKKRVQRIGITTKYLFILFVMLCSWISNPVGHPSYMWIMWLIMFYTVLDDLITQTVFTPLYLVAIVILFYIGHSIEDFSFALILFVIFFLFCKKTKETFFSIGDTFIILVLAFWMGKLVFLNLVLSVFLASSVLPLIGLYIERQYYPFSIFLILAAFIVQNKWHVFLIFLITFILNLSLIGVKLLNIKISKRKKK